jgi:hypothetical protein
VVPGTSWRSCHQMSSKPLQRSPARRPRKNENPWLKGVQVLRRKSMAKGNTQELVVELLQQLREQRVGGDLGLVMQVVRGLTGDLREDRTRSARTTNALLLVQEAAELASVLALFDSLGIECEGNLDDLHERVAAARRVLAGFVSKGCRDLELPDSDKVALVHTILERRHSSYLAAPTAEERALIVAEACGAIVGVFGREPDGCLVGEALAIPFRAGKPKGRGRIPVLTEILRGLGLQLEVQPALKMLARARSRWAE